MEKNDLNPLERFSDRVSDYVRYRPSYPHELLDFLGSHAGLVPGVAVADVGSGTGIFTRLLLDRGARVSAVEPNDAMRAAAEFEFRNRLNFTSMKGTGEATGLPDRSVALITCAQAFHWLDHAAARLEFMRILVPEGWCALVWNTPLANDPGFGDGYEQIKERFGTDFQKVRQETEKGPEHFDAFFGRESWGKHVFDNFQDLDYPGLKGRLLSSSYAPKEGHPSFAPMLEALRVLFDRHQVGQRVRMKYATELFLGRLV